MSKAQRDFIYLILHEGFISASDVMLQKKRVKVRKWGYMLVIRLENSTLKSLT